MDKHNHLYILINNIYLIKICILLYILLYIILEIYISLIIYLLDMIQYIHMVILLFHQIYNILDRYKLLILHYLYLCNNNKHQILINNNLNHIINDMYKFHHRNYLNINLDNMLIRHKLHIIIFLNQIPFLLYLQFYFIC